MQLEEFSAGETIPLNGGARCPHRALIASLSHHPHEDIGLHPALARLSRNDTDGENHEIHEPHEIYGLLRGVECRRGGSMQRARSLSHDWSSFLSHFRVFC